MKDIRSVRKTIEQRRKEKAISPIFKQKRFKINFNDRCDKVFDKICDYYCNTIFRKEKETDEQLFLRLNEEISSMGIKFTWNKLDRTRISSISTDWYSIVSRGLLRYNFTAKSRPDRNSIDWDIYEIKLYDQYSNEYNFYTTLDVKISKKFRNSTLLSNMVHTKYRIKDIYRLISELIMIKDMEEYIMYNPSVIKQIAVEEFQVRGIPGNWVDAIADICNYCRNNNMDIPNIVDGRFISITRFELSEMYKLFKGENKIFASLDNLYSNKLGIRSFEYINEKYIILSKFIFREMARDNDDLVIEEFYEKDEESSYARAFETKKYINKKVLQLMKYSKFNQYFNYVEYDNDTDKVKIRQIENEFEKVYKDIYIDSLKPYISNRTIRFRKLGKHRASGLYWSTYNCVCIDLDGVFSTMHEMLHMLDYTMLKDKYLRELDGFRPIAMKYMQELEHNVSKLDLCDPFRVQFNGNSKYNRNYYRNRAEIFARCGELYLRKCLGIESPLLNDCSDIQYPDSKELLDIINKFYSKNVFIGSKEKNKDIKECELNQVFSENEYGQISFVI